jgi:cytochrome c
MRKLIQFLVLGFIAFACSPDKPKTENEENDDSYEAIREDEKKKDDGRGLGEVKQVTLNTPLEQERIVRGVAIYEMKCQACHKLDDQRVVGPGWKDITKKRKPEWIMNMITNVDVMLDKDPEAQKLLEMCLMRMPNQNVTVGDARDILEFMRKNDGEK